MSNEVIEGHYFQAIVSVLKSTLVEYSSQDSYRQDSDILPPSFIVLLVIMCFQSAESVSYIATS